MDFQGMFLSFQGVFQFLFWRFKYLHPWKLTYIPWKIDAWKDDICF